MINHSNSSSDEDTNPEVLNVLRIHLSTECPRIIVPVCMATVEELYIQLSQFLQSCIGKVSTWSLRPCLSQSDK